MRAATSADGWTLTIEDSGMGLSPQWQDGVGLANTRQRLAHAFGERAELTITAQPQGTAACIHIRLDT